MKSLPLLPMQYTMIVSCATTYGWFFFLNALICSFHDNNEPYVVSWGECTGWTMIFMWVVLTGFKLILPGYKLVTITNLFWELVNQFETGMNLQPSRRSIYLVARIFSCNNT
jgi:hypothetical protein